MAFSVLKNPIYLSMIEYHLITRAYSGTRSVKINRVYQTTHNVSFLKPLDCSQKSETLNVCYFMHVKQLSTDNPISVEAIS